MDGSQFKTGCYPSITWELGQMAKMPLEEVERQARYAVEHMGGGDFYQGVVDLAEEVRRFQEGVCKWEWCRCRAVHAEHERMLDRDGY